VGDQTSIERPWDKPGNSGRSRSGGAAGAQTSNARDPQVAEPPVQAVTSSASVPDTVVPREALERLQRRASRGSAAAKTLRTTVSVPTAITQRFDDLNNKLVLTRRDGLNKQQWVDYAIERVLTYPDRYARGAGAEGGTQVVAIRVTEGTVRELKALAHSHSQGLTPSYSAMLSAALAEIIGEANKAVRARKVITSPAVRWPNSLGSGGGARR